jgi:hypothetical protein
MRFFPLFVVVLVLTGFVSSAAQADDVTVTATISPSVVSLGNEALLVVNISGKFRRSADPVLPPLEDFDVYDSGTSQNFSLINGRMQSSISFQYTLVPKKQGLFKIDPIRFTVGGKEYQTKALALEVVEATNSVSPRGAGPARPGDQTPAAEEARRDRSIFIQAEVDRDTVYVNQQITWTLGYYSDGRITLLRSPNYTPPEAEGFWVEDLPPQNKYYSTLSGRQYLVNEIKRGYFPTAPGVFEIGAAKVDVVIDDFSSGRADDFFNRSFSARGFGKAQTLSTQPKQIVVLPLPQRGRPDGFAGVVARDLTLSMSADKQVVQAGEPVNVTVELNGRGNIKTAALPPLGDLKAFKVYESGSQSDVFKKGYVVSGRKKYDFVVVPKNQGKHTIPAVELPYFDPVKKRYSVARSHPVKLDVKPGTREEGRKVIYAGTGDQFEVISEDIRFIKPVPSVLALPSDLVPNARLLLALHVIPLLAVGLSLAAEKRRRRFRNNVSLARSSRALRDAEKRLNRARKLFEGGSVQDGFAAVSQAVFGYFADKLNTAPAGLTSDVVDDYLASHNAGEQTAEAVRRVIRTCDAARFASGSVSGAEGIELATLARETIRSVERECTG